MINSRHSEARQAWIQEEREAGTLADKFPEVEKIIVTMTHWQRGIRSVVRNRWFHPSSFAFFKMSCLSKHCVNGGFDMSRLITEMIGSRSCAGTGELDCYGVEPKACPAHVAYEIAIAYV
jgi:hypothetical protein